MGKFLTFLLILAVGYAWFSYWQQAQREANLKRSIEKVLGGVSGRAQGLTVAQQRELVRQVASHGFVFTPRSIRFSTSRTYRRPALDLKSTSDFTEHVVTYGYTRHNMFLPFVDEEHTARTTALVEVAGTGVSPVRAYSGTTTSAYSTSRAITGKSSYSVPTSTSPQFPSNPLAEEFPFKQEDLQLSQEELNKFTQLRDPLKPYVPPPAPKHKSAVRWAKDRKKSKRKSSVVFKKKN